MDKLAWRGAATLLLLTAANPDGIAAQRKEVHDGLAVEAVIATREVTRIRVEGAMITGVVGKLRAAQSCQPKPEGVAATAQPAVPQTPPAEASITCDLAKGEVYLRTLGSDKKPINIFISTDQATYTLVLRKADVPSDTIVLVDPDIDRAPGRTSETPVRQTNHVKSIKSMLRAMVARVPPNDLRIEDVNVVRQLWHEASIAHIRNFRRRGLLGEQYLLTNTSTSPITVTEQEFDRDGADVLAVSLENLNLRPGDTTSLYIIRSEGRP